MTRTHRRRLGPLLAISLVCMGAIAAHAPVAAMQILDAADHAELSAEISATQVNRIALAGDRIAKAVRAPDGFAVEHDAASGELYLRSAGRSPADGTPVTLFIGTEKGFTYRLTLTPSVRDSAQILIRNGEALPDAATLAPGLKGDPHVAALVRLVRTVARREPLPGYSIDAAGVSAPAGLTFIGTWRGPRFLALVFEAALPASDDAGGSAGLARTIGALPGAGRVAALWLAAPGAGPSGGRLGVAVVEARPSAALAGAPR